MSQDPCPAITNVSKLDANIYNRKKFSKVQNFLSFKVEPKMVEFTENYWMEDIALVEELKKSNQDKYLTQLDGLGTCVDIFKNPGVKIQETFLCNEPGFCNVCSF